MKLYDSLLLLFPKSFRLEYGEEMRSIFKERRAAAADAVSISGLWADTLMDVIPNALMVHWDILRQDMRFTLRALGRAPGFAITAILVAALGVGATTAAFSVTDRVLIRPLPFSDPDRLVKVWQSEASYTRFEPSPAVYRDWKRMSRSFEDIGAYTSVSMNLVGGGEPMRIQGASVTEDLLPLLGVTPLFGRLFTPDEDREGALGTVLLSHGLWKDAFGGREGAIGRTVRLDAETGRERWKLDLGAPPNLGPTLAAPGVVVAFTKDRILRAIRTDDGKQIWHFRLGAVSGSESFAAAAGRVFVTDRAGWINAFDAATGKSIWRRNEGFIDMGGPCATSTAVISSARGRMTCRDADSGDYLWRLDAEFHDNAAPAASAGRIFVLYDNELRCYE